MKTARPRPTAAMPALATLLAGLALAGCASVSAPALPARASLTAMGQYENLAGCVAEAAEKSLGGAAALRVDRAGRSASVRRVLAASPEVQYEISFVQTGATTVQVEGRSTPAPSDGARAFAFLWPHVELCATSQMAP